MTPFPLDSPRRADHAGIFFIENDSKMTPDDPQKMTPLILIFLLF